MRLRRAGRTYGERQALFPIDMAVRAGECVALMGSNGSGKSTLLRLASGREKPTTGSVLFEGHPMREEDPRTRARIAVVGDTVSCYPDLTARAHLLLVARAQGVGDAAAEWTDRVLAERGLTAHADSYPSSLSSGQMQSLLLGCAFVRPRDMLILDEPEQRLDPAARDRLAEQIKQEKRDGVAVLLATHHTDLAGSTADRVIVLEEGRVIAAGATEKVLKKVGL
ncbi:phosphonate metabolism protein PhnK [Streptomyces tsukubensis]|uniref:Phosphonate metabolism protein PhnK n=1 Tax=Streptomyces tsukubensis TaxID=83656 RepID=A0A1V4AC20_9ACTN|nr:phosphonate metabolism protein PhnK [Streptomyces tsukubensis]